MKVENALLLTKGYKIRDIKNGSIVRVKIISTSTKPPKPGFNYLKKIQINGKIINVHTNLNLKVNSFFDARAVFKEKAIKLIPLQTIDESKKTVFAQLNIPENNSTSLVLNFFSQNGLKLDPALIMTIVNMAEKVILQLDKDSKNQKDANKNLSTKEKNVLFASFLLHSKFANVSKDLVVELVDALSGNLEKKSLLYLVNQIKSEDKHWFIIPYSKTIEGEKLSGTIRLLIDLLEKKVLITEVYCSFDNKDWSFTIKEKNLCFEVKPPFSSFVFQKIGVYLQESLLDLGLILEKQENDFSILEKQVDFTL